MIHAENGGVVAWLTRQLEQRARFAPKYHAAAHPPAAESEATFRAIALAEIVDAPILIVHVSSPLAARHIREARQRERALPVFAETCPQYLFLTRADLDQPGFEGAKCVCAPPPREGAADHEAIWEGLRDGTFAVLSSDHCPFSFDDRVSGKKSVVSEEFPVGRFKAIPNGIPGVETRLALVLGAGRLDLRRFVQVTAADPARLYGLWPRKGALEPRVSDADLTIWYPEGAMGQFVLRNEMLHHDVDYTPYEGREFANWPRYTVLRGKVVWDRDGGGVIGGKGYGQFLRRDASSLARSRFAGEWDVEA
ncbi:hypothetical protein MPH_01648 [Macrophomina phaseolina MS6]|uniref:Amidohydrolase-related domain-containing protein n=2 Tax=Macrophomina phaseolina TaxID=35725 RepID=K2SF22_MACPH|nr:hypothetical protein MPH_01648 [Macrophomina phaseolina MS6]